MFNREAIESAQRVVRATMPPTSQQPWPLLDQRVGAQVWVKHENHTPVGAFKLRGGLTYFDALRQREPHRASVISATRDNHGQSVGFAARRHGMGATIVVPHGNSVEKNAAMRALFADTHNVAEGAGAAALAAALAQRESLAGRCVAITLSGGNVDSDVFARVLADR